MVEFHKLILVVEATFPETEALGERVAQRYDGIWDVWFKKVETMTDEEITEFFGRSKEEIEKEDEK